VIPGAMALAYRQGGLDVQAAYGCTGASQLTSLVGTRPQM
jgi:hypothetical protein